MRAIFFNIIFLRQLEWDDEFGIDHKSNRVRRCKIYNQDYFKHRIGRLYKVTFNLCPVTF